MLVPLREAIKKTGLSANTLRKYADNGTIQAVRVGKRKQRLFDVDSLLGTKNSQAKPVVCYCRVSSGKQKEDLARQVAFMRQKFPEAEIVQDIGSGLNFKKPSEEKVMKKISFSDNFQLTKAALERRKTQFRVAVSPRDLDKIEKFQEDYYDMTLDYLDGKELVSHYFFSEKLGRLPYKVGETVAIAQSYQETWLADPSAYHNPYFLKGLPGWKNKSKVQAILMPHQICIANVRTERLQGISEEDCLKEGIRKVVNENGTYVQYYAGEGDYACCFEKPQEAFAYLMNKVSKKDIWKINPFMFVYDFELVK